MSNRTDAVAGWPVRDRNRVAAREALYIISVAARLVDMHPSTLRKYERIGFLEPSRQGGKLRLYSVEDIERLRQIKYLVEERGINLAGIDLALELTDGLAEVRDALAARADDKESRRLRLLVDRLLELLGAIDDSPDQPDRVAGNTR